MVRIGGTEKNEEREMASAKQYRVLIQTLKSVQWLFKQDVYDQELVFLKGRIKTYKLMAQIRKHAPEYSIPRFPSLVDPAIIDTRYNVDLFEESNVCDYKDQFTETRNVLFNRLRIYHEVLCDEQSEGVHFMYRAARYALVVFDILVIQYMRRDRIQKIFYQHDTPFSDTFHASVQYRVQEQDLD